MSVKILSDFDGVWTDQVHEAEGVKRFLVAETARLARASVDETREHFERFEARVKAEPARFGWAPDGRITAYVDEDPFCEANAIAMYLQQARDDSTAQRYAAAILADGFGTLTKFADHCFLTATSTFRAEHPPALVPRAREMYEALVAAGAEIVVVSNSSAEKIVGWFRQIGLEASDGPSGPLRVRGSAGKFVIGSSDRSIAVGARRIFVDRPKYLSVIVEEDPDIVIGDVFSLDLALPHVLRSEGDPRAPDALVLRRHPHTPSWVLDTRAGGAIDHVVEQIGDLAEIVRRRRAASR
jgi:FMN phosphatase YigB (HAD superfamily)